MKKVLILGGNGRIAQFATQSLLDDSSADVTLLVRDANKVPEKLHNQVKIVVGDVSDLQFLTEAMYGIDLVYANLASNSIVPLAENVVKAIKATKVQQLIWVSTLGIYDEVPGKFGEFNNTTLGGGVKNSYLTTYADAAKLIQTSDVNYTIIRPAWLSDNTDVDYETTEADETFKGTVVSRKSVGTFIAKIIANPEPYRGRSIGVNKPNTDGDSPMKY
ncbi:NAD(P)H-binding protein [Paucilactobacillus nenjiangensis]|uniref:NAD(P)H-binding protein n=2 Tax=Paucilactobacillus nenjiangensis TaxID=1296540 RepID=A0A5P1WZ71_9LACO|nr:NAD(P)H-binding protein [Paucilactobacillus nenjiangensis]QER66445.1 NAD(P)H-binding protein [Paucilactobacillus nenjiangensis]